MRSCSLKGMTCYQVTLAALALVALGSACGEAFTSAESDGAGARAGSGGDTSTSTTTTGGASSVMSAATSSSTGGGATTGNGGSGGRDCFTCDEAIHAPTKLQPGLVCDGEEKDEYVDFVECLCPNGSSNACTVQCVDYCTEVGELSSGCIECINNNVCKSHYDACQEVSM